jgi:hypothetical protein
MAHATHMKIQINSHKKEGIFFKKRGQTCKSTITCWITIIVIKRKNQLHQQIPPSGFMLPKKLENHKPENKI